MTIDKTMLKPYDRIIIRVLEDAQRSLCAREVAELAHMNWATAVKHLQSLSERGLIDLVDNKRKKKIYSEKGKHERK